MKISVLILFFFTTLSINSNAIGQVDSSLICITKKKTSEIDSAIINDPGRFMRIRVDNENSGKYDKSLKIFPGKSKDKKKWYIIDFQTEIGDTVFTINYYDNFDKEFYLTFYYFKNNLIYSKLEYRKDKSLNTFYVREEWYNENRLIRFLESGLLDNKKYKRKSSIDLLIYGNKYLKVFADINNGS